MSFVFKCEEEMLYGYFSLLHTEYKKVAQELWFNKMNPFFFPLRMFLSETVFLFMLVCVSSEECSDCRCSFMPLC